MWPFKKKDPVIIPPSPCGHDKEHAYWKEKGWPCPGCHVKAERARKEKT